jgi:hypothetical protein
MSYSPFTWCGRLTLAFLGTMSVAMPAHALTPFSANESAGSVSMIGSGSVSDANAFCPALSPCGGYSASASASGASGGSVQATVTLSGVPFLGGGAQNNFYTSAVANVTYGIELLGSPGVSVPIMVIATLSAATASGYLSDQASLKLSSQVGDYYSETCYDGACYPISPQPVVLVSGRDYLVSLQASAVALADGTAFASVDPSFVIDPAYASQFTLVGVPGVPEPATWAMLIGGFGLVGAALRRRQGFTLRRSANTD